MGGGGGRYLMRSSSQHLALGGGLAWTNEDYTDPTLARALDLLKGLAVVRQTRS